MKRKFQVVAVGGTFDEFHRGHIALILKAFELGNKVLVGLSSDEFAKELERQKNHVVADYEERLSELTDFLKRNGLLERTEIVPLKDAYGVTLSPNGIDALVVSQETEFMAQEINKKREKLGFEPLRIIVVDMVPAENSVPISTTRIRRGEINREGKLLTRNR